VKRDYFAPVMLGLAIGLTIALYAAVLQRDEARERVHTICLDVMAGLERELLRPDVDSTETGLVLGASWQATRNCALRLETDAPFLDALYSGEVYLRRAALERIRERLEDGR
jgi:hypothetical protein